MYAVFDEGCSNISDAFETITEAKADAQDDIETGSNNGTMFVVELKPILKVIENKVTFEKVE